MTNSKNFQLIFLPKNLRTFLMTLVLASSAAVPSRTNVVNEVPTLDIGPLVLVRVKEGDTVRMPCNNQPQHQGDSIRLLLWYKNDTTRPFLSYDARNDRNLRKYPYRRRGKQPRVSLSILGASLVIQGATVVDQAEYRCTIHYQKSPSFTQRLQLTVNDTIPGIQVWNKDGEIVDDHVGPLPEGAHLSLICSANYVGRLLSLEWQVDGSPVASSWSSPQPGEVKSHLEMTLQAEHAQGILTCRLSTSSFSDAAIRSRYSLNITEASILILMFYVPQATLHTELTSTSPYDNDTESEKEFAERRANVEVVEGERVTFVCEVKARPPPYNFTWLHNGKVISTGGGGRWWASDNVSMVVSPVTREDSGLITCLASNSQGDGHSNALRLVVKHAPYCHGTRHRQYRVARNSSITLMCDVNSVPDNVVFAWTVHEEPGMPPEPGEKAKGGGVITGDPSHPHLLLIDLTPEKEEEETRAIGRRIPHILDPESKTRSYVKFRPRSDESTVTCGAMNSVGHTRNPCVYTLTLVEPPDQLQECQIQALSLTALHVYCQEPQPVRIHRNSSRQAPGLEYVRSSEARIRANLEVWALGTLVTNMSSEKADFVVRDLPPDTDFRLQLYSVSQYARSRPIVLYSKTGRLPSGEDQTISPDFEAEDQNGDIITLPVTLVGALVGAASVTLLLAFIGIAVALRKGRQRQQDSTVETTISPSVLLREQLQEAENTSSITGHENEDTARGRNAGNNENTIPQMSSFVNPFEITLPPPL